MFGHCIKFSNLVHLNDLPCVRGRGEFPVPALKEPLCHLSTSSPAETVHHDSSAGDLGCQGLCRGGQGSEGESVMKPAV